MGPDVGPHHHCKEAAVRKIFASALCLGLAACSSDLPSREEVVGGVQDLLTENLSSAEALRATLTIDTECIADEIMDTFSADHLKALAEGALDDPSVLTEKEMDSLRRARDRCAGSTEK